MPARAYTRAERNRFTRVMRRAGTVSGDVQQPRRQRRQRQQIESVVLQNRGERSCVAGSDELKVARRHFKAGNIANPAMPDQLFLERPKRAVVALPELPRRMQHVDVRRFTSEPFETMEQIARLEQRRVERLAVEADQRAGASERAGDRSQHRPLVRMPREHELPRHESVLVEPAAANEKHVRSGAAAESGGFEIEKHERRPRRSTAGKERRVAIDASSRAATFADPFSPVSRRRRPAAIDDEAVTGPATCERRQVWRFTR